MNGEKLKKRFLESRKFLFAQFALNRLELSQTTIRSKQGGTLRALARALNEEFGLQKGLLLISRSHLVSKERLVDLHYHYPKKRERKKRQYIGKKKRKDWGEKRKGAKGFDV